MNLFGADGADIAPVASPYQSNHVTVRIVDDDSFVGLPDNGPWAVSFAHNTYVVQEPSSGLLLVPVTLRRVPGSSNAVAVFATVGGTATAGADYGRVFREVVTFAPNELVKTTLVAVYADNAVEGTETIQLSLRNPTGGPVRGSPDIAVIKILDDDVPEIYFPGVLSFTEGSGGGTTTQAIAVELRDPVSKAPVTAPPGGITVQYSIVPLTARSPGDYASPQPITGTLSFAAGASTATISGTATVLSVDVVRDNTPELAETFAITLSNPIGAGIAEAHEFSVVSILDDDLIPVTGQIFHDANGNGFWDIGERPLAGVEVEILADGIGMITPPPTDATGTYTASVLLGTVSVSVDASSVKSPYQGGLVIFAGMPLATARREHIAIDLFDTALSRRMRCWQAAVGDLVCAFVSAILAWRIWARSQQLLMVGETTMQLGIPRGFVAAAMSLLMASAAIVFLCASVVALRAAIAGPRA